MHSGASSDAQTLRPLRYPAAALVIGIAGALALAVWGFALRHSTGGFDIDLWLDAHHQPALSTIALTLSKLFSPGPAVVIGFLFAVVVALLARRVSTGLAAGLVVGLTWASSDIIKLAVHRPRPDWAALTHHVGSMEVDPSYPSGHVTFLATLTLVTVLLLRSNGLRVLAVVVGVVGTAVLSWARLYVGAHYLTDVLAAAAYGALVTPAVYVVLAWLSRRTPIAGALDRVAAKALPRLFGERAAVTR